MEDHGKVWMSKYIHQFHDDMMARDLDDVEPSEAFPVTNGVKQGCVRAPTLFSMMFVLRKIDLDSGSSQLASGQTNGRQFGSTFFTGIGNIGRAYHLVFPCRQKRPRLSNDVAPDTMTSEHRRER